MGTRFAEVSYVYTDARGRQTHGTVRAALTAASDLQARLQAREGFHKANSPESHLLTPEGFMITNVRIF